MKQKQQINLEDIFSSPPQSPTPPPPPRPSPSTKHPKSYQLNQISNVKINSANNIMLQKVEQLVIVHASHDPLLSSTITLSTYRMLACWMDGRTWMHMVTSLHVFSKVVRMHCVTDAGGGHYSLK